MNPEAYNVNLKIIIILSIGFALASILGYLSQRIKLSPILGYLIAGYIIGPYFPGFVADLELAEQLAEVGVMLMMFGVGLHFKWQDLVNVKNIAIPGAIGQTTVAVVSAAIIMSFIGRSWETGVIIGLAIGVASTVVLVRVLSDQNLLNTPQGHISVGWLIVEDILTVAVLILLPTIVGLLTGSAISIQEILFSVLTLLFKFILLALFMFTLGRKFVSYSLLKIAQTKSQELFTLTILALIFVIAVGSALLFGTSIALGAFLAGMVIGQTDVSHQASAYASPLKDTFVVIFFLSVGMLFNPAAIADNFLLFISVLAIILVIKPLTAFLIIILLRYPISMALTISFALAQIGEFSFILAEAAAIYDIFPDEVYDVIVACALISITVNPLFFKILNYLGPYIEKKGPLAIQKKIEGMSWPSLDAVVVGFGVIGEQVVNLLENIGYRPLVIDHNMDKVTQLIKERRTAIYGEASFPNMLKMAHIESMALLIITIPDISMTLNIIKYAKDIHPGITILARAKHLNEQNILIQEGIKFICCDEEEVCHAFEQAIAQLDPPRVFSF